MAVSTRIIKRRIKSVANTRKITKAMELVSAAKMRKSVQLTLASRSYAETVSKIVADVSKCVDPNSHPLLLGRTNPRTCLVIVAASDRGLCGGFNSQLLKKYLEFLSNRQEKNIQVVTVGKRAESAVKRSGYKISASFEAISNAPSFERTQPIGQLIYDEFLNGRVDRVFIVYTDFKNAVSQIPKVMQLLPLTLESEITNTSEVNDNSQETQLQEPTIIFEPTSDAVLKKLLPKMFETQIYQALLESSASEHSARMLAMKNATDNASNMLEDLTFTFNQARQANITREISEISAGKAAIE